ncbi:MAG: hypothetical protein AAF604_00425 [Acidobacteriota bacterium]
MILPLLLLACGLCAAFGRGRWATVALAALWLATAGLEAAWGYPMLAIVHGALALLVLRWPPPSQLPARPSLASILAAIGWFAGCLVLAMIAWQSAVPAPPAAPPPSQPLQPFEVLLLATLFLLITTAGLLRPWDSPTIGGDHDDGRDSP